MISAAEICYSKGFPLRKACTFLVFFFTFFLDGFGQDPANIVPSYDHIGFRDLPTVGITNPEDILISIDVGPENFVYVLSFGNVDKRNPDGTLASNGDNFITGLNSPLDIAVDSKGFIYIADYSEEGNDCFKNGKIKIFDPSGNLDRIQYTGFYIPTGLDLDEEDNLYVTEYNPEREEACETNEMSRVSIYNTDGSVIRNGSDVNQPLRIAVDSHKNVYVSQAGTDPAVLKFTNALVLQEDQGELLQVESPGSIVIDAFDYIHVIEYSGRVDFSRFINVTTLSIGDIIEVSHNIYDGDSENVFGVKIFTPDGTLDDFYKEEMDFPVDLAFNNCDKLYINNPKVLGSHTDISFPRIHTFIPTQIEFDLEIYKRTPAFDVTGPEITCPSDNSFTISEGQTTTEISYDEPTFTDENQVTLERTAGPASGTQQAEGTYPITYTATDVCGNQDECTFIITVVAPEETNEPPVFTDCPGDIQVFTDPGVCGAEVIFSTPTATDDGDPITPVRIDSNTDLESGDVFPVGTTTITYEVDDGVNDPVTCSFDIVVSDNEPPVISDCIDENPSFTIQEDETHILDNYASQVVIEDNCDTDLTLVQTPEAGTSINEDQLVTITVIDEAGNESEACSFTVTIVEEGDTEPPVINCPEDISQENDPSECGAIITFADATATDNSGVVTVTRTDETGLNSGDIFPIGETVISFQAIDQTGNTDNCSFTITVSDMESPTISCPDNREETVAPGSEGKTIIYDIPDFQDNCTGATITRIDGIASGNVFPIGPTTNTFRVTDAAGNISECSFTVTIVEEEDTDPPVINCPEDIIVINDPGVCGAIVEFDEITASDENEVSFTRTDDTDLFSGDTFPVGNTTLSFRATDAAGNSSNCSFSIIVSDEEEPEIRCVASYSVNVSPGQSKIIYPADLDSGTRDNCDIEDLSLSQDSFTVDDVGTVPVTLTATDPAGNSSSCTVNVEVILINNNQLSLSCPEDYPVYADENCEYVVPDFSEIVEVSPEGATIEQSIEPGSTTITNADPFITITASYEGQTETCDIYLVLTDEISPVIDNCPSNTTVTIAQGETYTLPDYRDQLEISDNCGNATVVQDPAPGTPISQDSLILFTATDGAGNTAECSFQLNIAEEGQLDISCLIEEYILSPNDNCEYLMPNLDDVVQYSPSEAEFNQSVAPGTELQEDTEVEVSVTFEGETKTCNLYVSLQDDVSPQAVCINALEIILDEGETRTLNASEIDNGSSDNCGEVSLSLSKNEFTTEDEGANTVILTVTDGAGNTSTCETIVTITVNNDGINQPPVAYDEEYTTNVNTQLNVSAENGVLVNDTDPENDELTAILDTDVDNGTLQLNSDGSFTYTPDNGFVGQDFFTYRANDGEYNSEVIFVSINVVDDTGDFGCTSQVVLGLGEEGEANLDIELLYYGNTDGIDLTADKLTFTCEDIGENVVTLMYTGAQEGFCEIPVMVLDDAPPVLDLRDISIDLDLEGNASISFEDINNGSFDVCDENVTYTLSKSLFTCKELGGNIIQVSAEDAAGNISTATVSVQVFAEEGICSEPLPGSEYIFVYPNPNSGSFKIATPGDVSIQRIEVFDHRGRFITARDYQANATEYSMELNPLQEAVYILKLETNEGEVVKRMIFER